MKAVINNSEAKPEYIETYSMEDLNLKEGFCKIKVLYASLNPVDWKILSEDSAGKVIGCDAVGMIVEQGPGVEEILESNCVDVSKPVVMHINISSSFGAISEYTIANSHVLINVPEYLSAKQAAAVPCAGYTALQCIVKCGTEPNPDDMNNFLLINGASGGVGSFSILLAKQLGWTVIAVASTANKEYCVDELGADHFIDYRTENIVERVSEITNGDGCIAIIDNQSHRGMALLSLVSNNGFYVPVPGLWDKFKYDGLDLLVRGINICHVGLGAAAYSTKAPLTHTKRHLKHLCQLAKQFFYILGVPSSIARLTGSFKITEIEMADVPDIMHQMQSQHSTGKYVVRVSAEE
ncbi:hypothetical protein PCE1_001169 [Barthelona sp. PCE]